MVQLDRASSDRLSSDRTLIHECLQGNREAVRLLVERHQTSLFHYACGFTPDAEEARRIVARAFRRSLLQLPRLRRNSLLSSFLIGQLRKELTRSGFKQAGRHASEIWRALAGLPRVQREVVFLYFQGFDIRELARIRNEPASYCRSRLGNALCRIVRRIKKGGTDTENNDQNTAPSVPAGCLEDQELHLAAAGSLAGRREEDAQKHLAHCAFCRRRAEEAAGVFESVRREIESAKLDKPLIEDMPSPSGASALIAIGVVIAAVLLVYLLLRGPLQTTVKSLPPASARPGAGAPVGPR